MANGVIAVYIDVVCFGWEETYYVLLSTVNIKAVSDTVIIKLVSHYIYRAMNKYQYIDDLATSLIGSTKETSLVGSPKK